MKPDQMTARIAGSLFIVATVASLLSTGLLNPVLSSSDYLSKIAANQNQVVLGALCQMVAAFASAGIAISLYPVLRKHREGLALGAVGLRVVEGVLYIASALAVLLLLSLSREFVTASGATASSFQTTGTLLKALRDQSGLAGSQAFYIGALLYYVIFYESKLIPRWLSGWGVVGVALGLVASVLVMFRVIGYMSTAHVGLNLPIAVQEMVLAVWLIVKGFNSSKAASVPANQR